MSTRSASLYRRRLLAAPLASGIAWLAGAFSSPARAQEKATLLARRVERVPEGPDEAIWAEASPLPVPLAPQAVVKPRVYETGVTALSVRALYDAERVALRLEWADPSREAAIGGVRAFRDAVAVEFPAERGQGIPYFGMGEPGRPVTIYQWKADWGAGEEQDVDELFPAMAVDWYPFAGRAPGEIAEPGDYGREGGDRVFHTSWSAGNPLGDVELHARTAIEKLRAEGFGTLQALAPEQQDARGQGAWEGGGWKAVISIPRAQGAFTFEAGDTVPFAFAAWDGSRDERGGEKAVSTWYFLSLERPVARAAYLAPLVAFAGVLAAQAWGLRRLRRRHRAAGDEEPGAPQ